MDTGLRPSMLIPEGTASAMLTRAYIASVARSVPLWLSERKLDEKFLRLNSISEPSIARLKRLLPSTLPITRSGWFTKSVAAMLVKSSGRLVTAASMTPPIKAPEILVVLSRRSTYSESFTDMITTAATIARYII